MTAKKNIYDDDDDGDYDEQQIYIWNNNKNGKT